MFGLGITELIFLLLVIIGIVTVVVVMSQRGNHDARG